MIANFFYIVFYQPLFNLLIFLYNNLGDLGLAVIVLTLIIKLILYPISAKATKNQKDLTEIQPKIKEIQEKYKDNKEKQAEKVLELYSKENISPFSGILPLMMQFPIIISVFQIFRRDLGAGELVHLYEFVARPEIVNYFSFGVLDLSSPNIILGVFAGVAQFFQIKITMPEQKKEGEENQKKGEKKPDFGEMMKSQMKFMLPLFTIFILSTLPAAVGVYWIITTLFAILQYYLIKR